MLGVQCFAIIRARYCNLVIFAHDLKFSNKTTTTKKRAIFKITITKKPLDFSIHNRVDLILLAYQQRTIENTKNAYSFFFFFFFLCTFSLLFYFRCCISSIMKYFMRVRYIEYFFLFGFVFKINSRQVTHLAGCLNFRL